MLLVYMCIGFGVAATASIVRLKGFSHVSPLNIVVGIALSIIAWPYLLFNLHSQFNVGKEL